MKKNFWLNFFLICVGIVLGAMVSEMTAGIPVLSWLSYGLDFGTETPIILDLNVLRLTMGLSVNISVSTIIFVSLSLLLGRILVKH
ncbi:MAG: DUF4321 domain-containing protein [Clostridia bacterium]|nr:DUF4321 domain-containing protein [Clostridia bacterium]